MALQTVRLNLRELSLQDLHNVHRLHLMAETDRFNTLGIPETIDTTKAVITEWLSAKSINPRPSYVFCMEHINTSEFIGLIALNLRKSKFKMGEVWYKIQTDHWRKGYTTEALMRLLGFGFNDLKLHRIEAGCAVENMGSIKVLEKAGFTREGLKRKILPVRGEWLDAFFYGILEDDFKV